MMLFTLQKSNPGNFPVPKSTSIVKQISPATPSISEYGLSLTPVLNLSSKSKVFISFITPFYSLSKANNVALRFKFSTSYGNSY